MVKYRKEFRNILGDCLDRIVVKGESIEQCLQSYPGFAGELEPLLKTALLTRKAAAVAPRPEFRARARFQFQAALRDVQAKKEKRGFAFGWQPRFATVVISAVLALVVAGSGTVAAAGNSLPDSLLYPVKLATEEVQLKLAGTPLEKAEVYAKLADKRVVELVKMAEKGKPQQVEKVARRLNGHLTAMAMAAKANGEIAMMTGERMPMMPGPMMAPVPAPEQAAEPAPGLEAEPTDEGVAVKPEPAKPVPKRVPGPVAKPAPEVTTKPTPAKEKAPVAIAPTSPSVAPQPLDPVIVAKMQKRAQLKGMMMQKAVANPQAIREAMKNVPESVKSALQQALTVADSGYQQAIEALEK